MCRYVMQIIVSRLYVLCVAKTCHSQTKEAVGREQGDTRAMEFVDSLISFTHTQSEI